MDGKINVKLKKNIKVNLNNGTTIIASNNHDDLRNLDYENSGHIGFASSEDIKLIREEIKNIKNDNDKNTTYTFEGKENGFIVKSNDGQNQEVEITPKIQNATIFKDGLMSSDDKTKLEHIEENANKTIVDNETSTESKNPLQNNIITRELNKKVDKEEGKSLSSNDFTNYYKNILDNLGELGENNIIEKIKLNGTELPIYNKAINIPVEQEINESDNPISSNAVKKGINDINDNLKNYILSEEKGKQNGVATLGNDSKIVSSQLPDYLLGQVLYGGNINSSFVATITNNLKLKLGVNTSTITLSNTAENQMLGNVTLYGWVANQGVYFIVQEELDFANIKFLVGDWLISTGTKWDKIDNTDAVSSVNGKTGVVNIGIADINGLSTAINNAIASAENKVDSKEGYSLVPNDEIEKLTTVEKNANYYVLPNEVVKDAQYVHTDNNYTAGEKEKLSTIERGAKANVQSNWKDNDSTSDSYILNKPTKLSDFENDLEIGTYTFEDGYNSFYVIKDGVTQQQVKVTPDIPFATETKGGLMSIADKQKLNGIELGGQKNVQSNWLEQDETSGSFIRNKPTIPTVWDGQLIMTTDGGHEIVFSANSKENVRVDLQHPKNISYFNNNVGYITTNDNAFKNKVDKVTGKELSTNDFTNEQKTKLDNIKEDELVYDTSYVHTDNNYTTDEKNKLSKIQDEATKVESSTTNGNIKINGIETNVYTLPNNVVQDSAYVHTDNNYTTTEKDKLTSVQKGATKVEDSSTNGNILINGTETNVYTLPTDVVHDSNYVHTDNNYTTTDKNKLNGIDNNAKKVEKSDVNGNIKISGNEVNVYTLPSDVPHDSNYVHTDNNYTDDEKNKLVGIEERATRVLVDENILETSKNPVQNKVIVEELKNYLGVVDCEVLPPVKVINSPVESGKYVENIYRSDSANALSNYLTSSDYYQYQFNGDNYKRSIYPILAYVENEITYILTNKDGLYILLNYNTGEYESISWSLNTPYYVGKNTIKRIGDMIIGAKNEEIKTLISSIPIGTIALNPIIDTKKLYRVPDITDLSKGTPVPNTGTVEKVYFNTKLTVDEVKEIINSLPKDDWVASAWGVGKDLYLVRPSSGDTSKTIYITDNESGQILIYAPNLIWVNKNLTDEQGGLIPAGWQTFDNPIELNVEVTSELYAKPSGTYNEQLSSLFSLTEIQGTGIIDAGHKYYKYNPSKEKFELFGAVTNTSSGGSSGTIDDSNLAKLDSVNIFQAYNTFNNSVRFNGKIIDSLVEAGKDGQVLTSTSTGVKWRTPINYPTINSTEDLNKNFTKNLTQEEYDSIIQANGFYLKCYYLSYEVQLLFIINEENDTELKSLAIICNPDDSSEYLNIRLEITKSSKSCVFYTTITEKFTDGDYNKISASVGFMEIFDYDISNNLQYNRKTYFLNKASKVKYKNNIYSPQTDYDASIDDIIYYTCIKAEENKTLYLKINWSLAQPTMEEGESLVYQDVIEMPQLPNSNPLVPNTGAVTSLYFNTSLDYEDILRITENLTWIDATSLGFVGAYFYPIFGCTIEELGLTLIVNIMKNENGLFIVAQDGANFEVMNTIFASITNVWNAKFSNSIINIEGLEVLSEFMGIPIGTENDKLTELISTEPYTKYSKEKLCRIPIYNEQTLVPNTGNIDKIYFNKNITVEEFLEITNSLSWTDASVVGDSGFSFNIIMGYLIDEVPYALVFIKEEDGYMNLSLLNYATNEPIQTFYYYNPDENTLNWDSFSNPYTISKDVISDFMGLPIGAENDKLKSLISINSYKPISYDYYEIKDGKMKSFNKWEMAENGTFVAGTLTEPNYLQIPINDGEELELYIDTGAKDENNSAFDGIYIGIVGYFTFTFAPEQSVKVQIKKISNKYFITISGHMKHTSDNYRYVNKSFVMSDFDGKISIDGFSSGKEVNWYCLKK